MSGDSPRLLPGIDPLTIEKIQNGIKNFFAQRGMFGDDVKVCQAGQNINYSLKDKDKDAKINNIIKNIVEKSIQDLTNLRQLISLWDKEERATSNAFIGESSYGVVTQQKIKQHLKDFFNERLMIAEQEEGQHAADTSALRRFARGSTVKTSDSDTDEESSACSDDRHSRLEGFSQTLDGSPSPNSVTSTSPACFLDKAKDLIGQVLNPVVAGIDTASKTIVGKVKSTLQKVGPKESEEDSADESSVSEMESGQSVSATSEESWTPNLANFFSAAASPNLSDGKGESPLHPEIFHQVAPVERCDRSEEAAESPLKDTEADDQATCVPDSPSEAILHDDPLKISTASLGSTSTASNLDNDQSVGGLDSSSVPASDGIKSPDGEAYADLESTEEGRATKSSSEAANDDLEWPRDRLASRSSSEAVDDHLEFPEESVEKTPSPEKVDDDSVLPEDHQDQISSEELDSDLKWPEDSVAKTPSSEEVVGELKSPMDQIDQEIVECDLQWPEDSITKRSSSGTLEEDLKSPEDQVQMSPSPGAAVEADLVWPEDRVENAFSSEMVATSPEWQEDLLAKRTSLELVDPDLEWQEDPVAKNSLLELEDNDLQVPEEDVAKISSSEAEDTLLQWPEDRVSKTPSVELVTDAVEVSRMSSAELLENCDLEWPEDIIEKRLSETGEDDLKSPEDRVDTDPQLFPDVFDAKTPSAEALADADPQLIEDQEVRNPLLEEAIDAAHQFDVKMPSVETVEDDDAILSAGKLLEMSSNEMAVDTDTRLSGGGVSKTPSAEADLHLVAAEVKPQLSQDRVSRKSLSPAEEMVGRKSSQDRISTSSSKASEVRKLSEDQISRRRSSSKTAVEAISKLSEDQISRRSSSRMASDASKLSEDQISRRSSSRMASDASKLSEDQISRRSSSKTAVEAISKLSEDQISRRSSSRMASDASKLSEDQISRRSSSRMASDASKLSEDQISKRSSSKTAVESISKLSEGQISRRSSSKVMGDIEHKLFRDKLCCKSLSEVSGKKVSAQVQPRRSLWKRLQVMRPRKMQPLLQECPTAFINSIRAKPAIMRPIFTKVKSMWKTHYGRRKSKRVKAKCVRKAERPLRAQVSGEKARAASVASSIKSVELPPDDDDDDERSRPKAAQSMADGHDIHSFFENMFIKEFSKRLEKSLKRGLLEVVNDYIPEKCIPGSADKPPKK
ncbi:uncharacterized protein LOC144003126 isoform X2 [Festucalex cinctus]